MPNRDAIEAGFEFEERLFRKLRGRLQGLRRQPGSGSQFFAKLDLGASTLLWELKKPSIYRGERAQSFRLTKDIIDKARAAITGSGGVGGDHHYAVVIEIEDTVLIVHELDDYIAQVTEEVKLFQPTKDQQRHARADIPSALRDA